MIDFSCKIDLSLPNVDTIFLNDSTLSSDDFIDQLSSDPNYLVECKDPE